MNLPSPTRRSLALAAALLLSVGAPVPAGVPQPMFFFYGEARDTFGWPFQAAAGATVVSRQGTNECASFTINLKTALGINRKEHKDRKE